MLRKIFILVFIFVLASIGVLAQESPSLPEDANACDEGGSMEGKCNVDFDNDGEIEDFELAWAWACGWYILRYDAGIFAEIPSWCESLLAAELPVGTEEGSGGGFCYTEPEPEYYRIYDVSDDGFVDIDDKPIEETFGGDPPALPVCRERGGGA